MHFHLLDLTAPPAPPLERSQLDCNRIEDDSSSKTIGASLIENMAELVPSRNQPLPQAGPKSFHDFPGEVRNKVYFHALVDDQVTALIKRGGKVTRSVYQDWPNFYASTERRNRINADLLRASSTIKKEATPVLYGNHVFLVRNSGHFLDWIKQIGFQNAANVRMLRIEYTSMCRGEFLETVPSCECDRTTSHLPSFV